MPSNGLNGLKHLTFASAALAAALSAAQVQAQAQAQAPGGPADQQTSELQSIVVTAQRRSEKMVDVPISITALSAEQLTTANVQNLSDIQQLTPALRFDNQAGFFQPSIRGIGTGITTSGGGSNVGIYINGFYSPNPLAADFQLMNVSDVQVLKGPQGTLFGHNTTGGAILVSTPDPSPEPHAEVRASLGSYNAQRYQAYATTNLPEMFGNYVAMDMEGIFSKGNGFLTNIVNGDYHVGEYQDWTLRSGLKFQISDKLSVLARFTDSQVNDPTSILTNSNTDSTIDPTTGQPWGVQTYAVPGLYTTSPYRVANNLPTFLTASTDIAQVTVKADLDFANFTSYSQWRREDVNQSEDLDQTALPIFQLGLPIFDRTISQEFLLNSKPGPRLTWTAGLYFLSYTDTYVTYINNFITTPQVGQIRLGGSSTTTKNYAGYLDATYQVLPKLFVTLGARYSRDVVTDAYYNPTFSNAQVGIPGISSTKTTPRVVLRYTPTDNSSVYASFTEGYKAAIIDAGGSCQDIQDNFKCNNVQPEQVHAYEVGYKIDTHRFSNEAAAYLYNYSNLQVSEFLGAAQAYIVNAAESRIYGLEDQLHFQLNEHAQLNGGAAWTHARYLTFGTPGIGTGAPLYASCPPPPAVQPLCSPGAFTYVNQNSVLNNATMQHVPEWTATLGPRFTTGMTGSGEYSLSSNVYYSSELFFSPSGTQFLQPSYHTLAARAEWKDPSQRYMVALYGDNLTNERYRTQVQYNSFGIGASWSAPATWGFEVGAKF